MISLIEHYPDYAYAYQHQIEELKAERDYSTKYVEKVSNTQEKSVKPEEKNVTLTNSVIC